MLSQEMGMRAILQIGRRFRNCERLREGSCKPGEGVWTTWDRFQNRGRQVRFSSLSFAVAFLLGLLTASLDLLAARKNALPPVILISVDTLRADHLSCYGYRELQTPNIDALAHGGALFTQVSSQVPLTLPSHVSMLTSTYPFSNGVEDNGQPLGPRVLTLPSILQSRGYHTAAFVGSFVLDRRFGLDRGFDLYDSPFNLRRERSADPGEVKRLGEEVVDSAVRWIGENANGTPFFLFLHLYDLHQPYEVPFQKRSTSPTADYDTALAYEDRVLGTFFDFLRKRNLLDGSLVIFTSDHGESLGDHGESTHGYFIYQSTLHVPLIVHWPKGFSENSLLKGGMAPTSSDVATGGGTRNSPVMAARVSEPVGLIDIAPSILQFLRISQPRDFQGRGFLDLVKTKEPLAEREVVSESQYAKNHFGCSSLQSLRFGNFKYVAAPGPELYDLTNDPREEHNLYTKQGARARALSERLQDLRSRYLPSRAADTQGLDPEVAAALNSLGYAAVSKTTFPASKAGADPKDRIADFEANRVAVALSSQGRAAEAAKVLERLCARYPDIPDLFISLGVNLRNQGKQQEAIAALRKALSADPLNIRGHFDLAVTYHQSHRTEDALKELELILKMAPYYSRAAELMGQIQLERNEPAKARAVFAQLLVMDPGNYAAHYHLGMLASGKGEWSEAERHFDAATRSDPKSAEAHNGLGVVYLQTGKLELAQQILLEAVRLEPKWAETHFNLGLVFRQLSRREEAAREFRAALTVDPQFRPAREALNSPEFRAR